MSLIETRVLDVDKESGITHFFHFDHATGDIHTEERQDVTDLIDENKAHANETRQVGRDMYRVASIPMTVYVNLKKAGIVDDPVRFKKWLNDRDNRFFRTREGRV